MTAPEIPRCPFGQDVACAAAVGELKSHELAVQTAYMDFMESDHSMTETLYLAQQYGPVTSGAFGVEVLDLAIRSLGSGTTCGQPCPLQREINLRRNMRGNPGPAPEN